MLTYERDLARLSDGRHYAHRAEKHVTLKADSGVTLEIPGPRLLAQTYAAPWLLSGVDAYRSGAALLSRPQGSDEEPRATHLGELTKELLAALQRLPELSRQEAGRPYCDLRLYLTEASPAHRDAYLAEVVAHTRRLLPAYRPPAERKAADRAPAKTPAERKAESRERARRNEEASAREWLGNFLTGWDGDTDAPEPGSRWIASELYETAVEAIEESVDLEEERLDGGAYVVPGKRAFYAVADELLGARRRGAKGTTHVYVIPGA